jgi:TolA-binding protein
MREMPDRFRAALGVATALAALLLSACGTTSTPTATVSTSSPKTGTKSQFIAQAEAICRTLSAHEKPLRARQESLKGLPSAVADRTFVSLARQVVALSRAADRKLVVLPRPTGDRQALEKLLTSYSAEAAAAATIADAAANEEGTVGEDAEAALKRSIAANSPLADAFGMKDCFGSE